MNNDSWQNFCEYVNWAWLESIPLQQDLDTAARETCQQIMKLYAQSMISLESDKLDKVSSS